MTDDDRKMLQQMLQQNAELLERQPGLTGIVWWYLLYPILLIAFGVVLGIAIGLQMNWP
jgi:hypothetical protein